MLKPARKKERLLLDAVDAEGMSRHCDHAVSLTVVKDALRESCTPTSAAIDRQALGYALAGRYLHAFVADSLSRTLAREEEFSAGLELPTEYVACLNASGEGEVVVIPADLDAEETEVQLTAVGYSGPFVFLGATIKGPFTPLPLPIFVPPPSNSLHDARHAAAQAAFEHYDFGRRVGETSGWESAITTGPVTFSRPVFLHDPDDPDADSTRVDFTVSFRAGSAEAATCGVSS